jgi:hypothetical protein
LTLAKKLPKWRLINTVNSSLSKDSGLFYCQNEMETMPEKDPTNWTLATWALGFMMASIGGVVNWYSKVRSGHTKAHDIFALVFEIITSGFVGMIVFMSMDAMGHPMSLCAAGAGVGGHMATRLLFVVERVIESRIKSINK